jgi:heptosyltransferase III
MTAARTLVVHTGGIGDLLLACPALRQLAAEGPLEIAGHRERAALAVQAGIAQRAHELDAIAFHSLFVSPSPALAAFLDPFTRVVVWMRDDGTIRDALRALGVPDARVFPGIPQETWTGHANAYYSHCLGFAEPPPLHLDLGTSPERRDIVIHPGSGGKHKNWPLQHFLEVAGIVEQRGRAVTWCRGPAEFPLPPPPHDSILEQIPLLELARVLAAAKLYIGNDSGITHLAAAVGCPTIVLFGPTNPIVWAPRGDHVTVVRGNPWPRVSTVLSAVDQKLM